MTTHPAPDALRLVPVEAAVRAQANMIDQIRKNGWTTSQQVVDGLSFVELLAAAAPAVQPAAGRVEIARALEVANQHIQHMAAWITRTNASDTPVHGYSFEALGEDKWIIDQGLAAISAPAQASGEPVETDGLVDRFADALKAKLRAAGEKYGFDDAWKKDDWREKLIEDLGRHVQKGDPRDVAAYCAFAWHHGWSLSRGEPMAGAKLAKAMWGIDLIPAHPHAQASREPWDHAVRLKGEKHWRLASEFAADMAKAIITGDPVYDHFEVQPLYAHPPAQASETGGEDISSEDFQRMREACLSPKPASDGVRAKVAAAAALYAPQAAPGEGEQS